ncbi:MAG: adenylate/guanylate cyclase domain-containing protein [Pseudomonadota bacterium]
MSHATLTAAIEDWLIRKALSDPDIRSLFERLCNRLRGVGIPLDRAALSWPTLHPLFRAEQAFWYPDKGAHLEQYYHSSAGNEHWVKSPFHFVLENALDNLRRRLTGPSAVLDFDVLHSFKEQGYTDYLMTSTGFHIAERETFDNGRTGIMASWMTKRENGFSDDDLEALRRIQSIFAVACRASIQRRVMRNIGDTYLGPTAARDVLSGEIKRGDGDRLRAVVWFSDLRGSTRLSDTMDPDSYLSLLNKYYECTAQPVIDHGGEILNFIGDGVLAIFPIEAECPIDAAKKAEAAVRKSLQLREEAEAAGTPGGAPLRFGVGLAIGEVMFGNIGVPQRLAFSGIGKVVNTVTRVEAATKTVGAPVLALPSFVEAAPGAWTKAGKIEIADFDKEVDVYTLEGLQTSGTSVSRAVSVGTPAE